MQELSRCIKFKSLMKRFLKETTPRSATHTIGQFQFELEDKLMGELKLTGILDRVQA